MEIDDSGKVERLKVRFRRRAPEERVLLGVREVAKPVPCSHSFVSYIVDEAAAEVECGACHEKLNPMWVLGRLANEDRRFAENQAQFNSEMKRLGERSRTACDHCGKMTRISRN